jgi:hypothetical protein
MFATLKRWFTQPPRELVEAKRSVDSSMRYVPYTSYAKVIGDTPVRIDENRPAGLALHKGNCVAFARAYRRVLKGRGKLTIIKLEPDLAEWAGQDWHCVLDVDGWRLDNMKRSVELI